MVAFQPVTAAKSVLGCGSAKISNGRSEYLRLYKCALMESSLRIKKGPLQRTTARRGILRWFVRGIFSISLGTTSCRSVPKRERYSV